MSEIKTLRLQTMDYSMLQQCMHCGMCLPTCPTYTLTKRERNSPRGRIAWMRAIADGDAELDKDFADEIYDCLGCLACVSACPAGVDYPNLFEAARADVEQQKVCGSGQRVFWRWLAVKTIFMHPRLLRLVGRGLYLYQASGLQNLIRRSGLLKLLPRALAALEPQTPKIQAKFSHQLIAPLEQPAKKRYRVGLLTGCVQDLAFSDINRDTADVLLHNQCEVLSPALQPCCGSLHAHNGELGLAKKLARQQLDLFPLDSLDAIISNAGGCGSHLKTYGHLLADDPLYAERAQMWDRKIKDIHQWLVEIDFTPPAMPAQPDPCETITYHESCHLCHGQKIRLQPRQILDAIPNLQRIELAESDWCCGSAGIYSITRPETAAVLLERKIKNIDASGSTIITTSNPGCHLQIQNGLKQGGKQASVRHPISLLAQAYRNAATTQTTC